MFELSQIRCFVAVAEELHFGRAAERLNMTQPPLSRQVQLLEHHVGTQLLDRTNRAVRLTAAGRAFFPEAEAILRMAEEAASTARRVAKGEQGLLSIGFTASLGYGLLPDMVRRFRMQVPGVSLTLRELITTSQMEALAANRLDIGLMRPHVAQPDMETVLLARDTLVLAIPEGEANKWPANPTLADLHQQPFLMYSPYEARYFYQLLQGYFDQAGVIPDVVEYVSQIHTMLALVGSGVGAALIPGAATRLQFSGIALRRLEMSPAEPVEAVCSFRKDNDNPMLNIFLNKILPSFRTQASDTSGE